MLSPVFVILEPHLPLPRPFPHPIPRAGYVSLFPLLLKLLPPDSQAVGSLLAQMR